MKSVYRIISLVLSVFLITLSLVGCADYSSDSDSSGTVATSLDDGHTESTAETNPAKDALEALKSEVNWGGEEFGLLYVHDVGGYGAEIEAKEKADSTSSSGVINDAVYTRNAQFEDICKLKFVWIPVSHHGPISTKLTAEAQTATGDFQLVTQTTFGMADSATAGHLYNYLNLDIDYEPNWWDKGTLDFALNGKVFFMNGAFNFVDDDMTFVMMFNKQLREDHRVKNPYDTVKAGEWTLDYFNSLISSLSGETSGDGKWDEQDTYGFSTPDSICQTLFYGAGLQYIKNNRDMEMPELLLTGSQMEKALNVMEKINTILLDNHSTYIAPNGSEGNSMSVFMEGRALFYSEIASYLHELNTSMTTEYGVLPIPKYSEEQENYTTWTANLASTMGIPTSIGQSDLDQFARVLEAYALLSEMYVRPAYYDHMLTTRSVRDSESSEMVDLIFLHRVYDMAMYFDLGLSSLCRTGVDGNTFASQYASASKLFDRRIERLLNKLLDN